MALAAEQLVKYNGPATGVSKFAGYVGKLATVKKVYMVAGMQMVDVKFTNESVLKTSMASKFTPA